MFGIKTKKDKRIEELERQLYLCHFKQPVINYQDKDIRQIAVALYDDGAPVDYIKRELSHKISLGIYEDIDWDIEDDEDGHRIIKGYLSYVRK